MPPRPQSAIALGSKDLVHNGGSLRTSNSGGRPQSALPTSVGLSVVRESVVDVESETRDDGGEDGGEMKYCLDGIIDEM